MIKDLINGITSLFSAGKSAPQSSAPQSVASTGSKPGASKPAPPVSSKREDEFDKLVGKMKKDEKECVLVYFRMLNVLFEIRSDLRRGAKSRWNAAEMCNSFAGVESHFIAHGYRPLLPFATKWHHTDTDIANLLRHAYLMRLNPGEKASSYASAFRRNILRASSAQEKQQSQG